MMDNEFKSLLRQASQASAGPAPSVAHIQARQPRRPSLGWPALFATAASSMAAVAVIISVMIVNTEPPTLDVEPDLFVLPDPLERSDWLAQSSGPALSASFRSDLLLAGMRTHSSGFASDALTPAQTASFDAYVIVDRAGNPITDSETSQTIYVIERTTP